MLQSVGVASPPLIGIGSPAQQALDIHTAMQVGLLQQCLSLAFRSLEASAVWNVQQAVDTHPHRHAGGVGLWQLWLTADWVAQAGVVICQGTRGLCCAAACCRLPPCATPACPASQRKR